jgi:hypothetical protein
VEEPTNDILPVEERNSDKEYEVSSDRNYTDLYLKM